MWTCIKPNLVSKNFPFTRGGPLTKIFFFQCEHVSSQIWCQKIFPLLGGGGPLTKKFFFPSEHVSSQIWCQKIFPLLGGVPWQKIFFPIWTCIKPNLVSKNFPFTRGMGPSTKNFFFQCEHVSSQIWYQKIFPLLGGVPCQNFFFQSEHVSSQIWCQNFFPLLGGGVPLSKKFFFQSEHVSSQIWCQKIFPLLGGRGRGSLDKNFFFSSLNMYQAKSGVKKFSLCWGGEEEGVPRQKNLSNVANGLVRFHGEIKSRTRTYESVHTQHHRQYARQSLAEGYTADYHLSCFLFRCIE